MKKRMFLSTILMTLVLLVAVTTATFAWYTASDATVKFENPGIDVSASETTLSVGEVTIKVSLSNPTSNVGPTANGTETVQGHDGVPAAGTKFFEVNGVLVKDDSIAYETSGVVTYTVSISGKEGLTESELWASAAGTYTITFGGLDLRYGADKDSALSQTQTYSITFKVNEDGTTDAKTGTVHFAVNSSYKGVAGENNNTLKMTTTIA